MQFSTDLVKQKALWNDKEEKNMSKRISTAFFPRHELIVDINNHMPLPELYTHARTLHTSYGIMSEHIVWFFCFKCGSWSPLESYGPGVCDVQQCWKTQKQWKHNKLVGWLTGWPALFQCVFPFISSALRMTIVNSIDKKRTSQRKDCMVSPSDCEVTSDNE